MRTLKVRLIDGMKGRNGREINHARVAAYMRHLDVNVEFVTYTEEDRDGLRQCSTCLTWKELDEYNHVRRDTRSRNCFACRERFGHSWNRGAGEKK